MRPGPTLRASDIEEAHRQAVGVVPEEHADLVRWLFDFAVQNGLSNSKIQTLIGTTTNINRIYKLEYGASLEKMCEKIRAVKSDQEIISERVQYGDDRFVDNILWEAISDTCHAARMSQTIVGIWGESQTGKTHCLKHVEDLKHERTSYIELDSSMTFKEFMQTVAKKLDTTTSGSIGTIRQGIYGALSPQHLFIFDEVHQLFLTTGKGTRLKILEAIRNLHDKCPGGKMGIVLCGTNTLRDEFHRGMIADVLKQTYKRGIIKVQCPPVLPLKEVWKFTTAFGLPRPKKGTVEHKLVVKLNDERGIGMLTNYLRDGKGFAASQHERYTWDHFVAVHDGTNRFEGEWWKD